MYYVNERTAARQTEKPGSGERDVYREFSDWNQSEEFRLSIFERDRREEALDKKLKELSQSSDSSSYSDYSENNYSGGNYRSAKMHWLYFLLIGWWLGLTMACLIFPLFIRGFVKKSFGYW